MRWHLVIGAVLMGCALILAPAARAVIPLTVTQTSPLNFGGITPAAGTPTPAATVQLNPSTGVCSFVAGGGTFSALNPATRGVFNIVGTPGCNISITCPSPLAFSGNPLGTINVSAWQRNLPPGGGLAACVGSFASAIPGSGTRTLNLGANLNIAAGQDVADYSGTYGISANYSGGGGPGCVAASAVPAVGNIRAKILGVIGLSQGTQMSFGSILPAPAGCTAILTTASTVSGACTSYTSSPVPPAAGQFTATGVPHAIVSLTLGGTPRLDDGGAGAFMNITGLNHDAGATPSFNGTGVLTFNVGATLTIGAAQVPGLYTTAGTPSGAPYTVTVNY